MRQRHLTPRVSSSSGEPLVSATQDFLTAAFVLTQRNIFMEKDEFCNVVSTITDALGHVDLPPPAIMFPVQLWTGKQVISMLLRQNKATDLLVNLELKEGNYCGKDKQGKEWKYMDPNEGYVCFRNSELMCGNLGKKTLGGKKTGLVYALIRNHSELAAAQYVEFFCAARAWHACVVFVLLVCCVCVSLSVCISSVSRSHTLRHRFLNRLTKMCTRWLTNFGFSISIEDVTPSDALTVEKEKMINDAYRRCQDNIAKFHEGTLPLQAGCDAEQSLESVLNGILGQLRDSVGKMSVTQLPRHNAPRIMATCGSKGSTLNICQMVACVGQQQVNGARIAEGFVDRTLPIFQVKVRAGVAEGMVARCGLVSYTWLLLCCVVLCCVVLCCVVLCCVVSRVPRRRIQRPRVSWRTPSSPVCQPRSSSSTPWVGERGWWTRL